MRNVMLRLKIIFIFCEEAISWRKMYITEHLNHNATSQRKAKAKANTHVVLYYK